MSAAEEKAHDSERSSTPGPANRSHPHRYPYPGAGLYLVEADVAVAYGEHREAEESVHRALAITGADLRW